MKHYLPRPTEAQMQEEVEDCNYTLSLYRESLMLLKQKREGKWHFIAEQEIINVAEQQYREAFHKIPTVFRVELEELLQRNHITV
jgi:hypothetical protein